MEVINNKNQYKLDIYYNFLLYYTLWYSEYLCRI